MNKKAKSTEDFSPYLNNGGNAGVKAYRIGSSSIDVEFADGRIYRYDYSRPGKNEVKEMKRLAESGRGLTTYINQYVRENYALRLK